MQTAPDGTAAGLGPSGQPGSWLRASRLGLLAVAALVGVGAGFGAVGFRELIFGITWLATGHQQFGQQGHVASLHFAWLGLGFFLIIPAVGGLLYGPLIQRFAPEARGHGVPEVMIAVAEEGGRIRPQVTVVKALASALCIGTGGSVGREGPIVQIGSALASSLGQVVRMPANRLRILVACGAAGAIAATFNAPLTGLFFGLELIVREFSVDALFAMILTATVADLISRAFFGSGPIFSQVPHGLVVAHAYTFLLVVVVGLGAGLIGVAFKTLLYKVEDVCDRMWNGRPEWLRPAAMGLALGAVLLALPQLYGVGYPIIDKAMAGHTVLGLLVILAVGKMFACSLTIGMGGSGGVFAPSLFTGAMAGTAFGVIARHLFGPAVGTPAIYGVIAMGAVFGSAAQAPLTSIASVVEMTGNFTLTLPVMLAVGIASGVSKRLTYGSIYTTKLLRRGTDIERARPGDLLRDLTVASAMQPTAPDWQPAPLLAPENCGERSGPKAAEAQLRSLGSVIDVRRPQALLGDETLEHALRQLVRHGRDGLPVLSDDRKHLIGWISHVDVLRALAGRGSASAPSAAESPSSPCGKLPGYQMVELLITEDSTAHERPVEEVSWPPGSILAGLIVGRRTVPPRPDVLLHAGDRALLLVAAVEAPSPQLL